MAEAANKEEGATDVLKEKTEENEDASGFTKQQQQKIEDEEELECAVCLQKCVHPVRLPCSHIFCFLCVKGVANQSKRCAMCRQEIPADFLDHPTLLSSIEAEKEEIHPGGYQWFYEGRNGWWQYDERTSHELEAAYGSGQRACEVLVAGFLYIIDFDRMVQLRRNDPSRRRRIKRDLSSIPKKGVAGIKLPSQLEAELSALHSAAHAIHAPVSGDSSQSSHEFGDGQIMIGSAANNDLCPPTPTAPSNTPQTPHTPSATSSSSGSPDTSEPSHMHALSTDSHRHHYHVPHHHHHLHFHHPVHIPHYLAHNLTSGSADHNIFSHSLHSHQPSHHHHSQVFPRYVSQHPTQDASRLTETTESRPINITDAVQSSPPPPTSELQEVVYQMDQLAISTDTPEYYPLDTAEVSAVEETEQYHLNLSSEDEQP